MCASFGAVNREGLESRLPRRGEIPFQSERKMMTTFHRGDGRQISFTKGAPDRVLKLCSAVWKNGRAQPLTAAERERIGEAVSQLASGALRTLAVACKTGGSGPEERDLIFLGMTGMKDPVRPEAAEAVETFRRAGVDTVMITGDHASTAFAIGKQLRIVGDPKQCMTGEELDELPEVEFLKRLEDVRIFARVSPADKVKIVRGFQKKGNIVAMTGDGVNDAPSLKIADVGVAMGKGGTDVARQAADLVLTDDNFATIEKAIEEGRGVYENIKKSVVFLLSSNLGEILTMFAAVLLGLPSPLKSSHILWINLITDSLPALALGVDRNDGKELMGRPPRKAQESLFSDGGLSKTLLYGILIAGISLTAFFTLPWYILKEQGLPFSPEHIGALFGQRDIEDVPVLDDRDGEQQRADPQRQQAQGRSQFPQPLLQRGRLLLPLGHHGSDLPDFRIHAGGNHDSPSPAPGDDGGHIGHVFPVAQGNLFPALRQAKGGVLLHRHGFPGEGGFLRLQLPGLCQAKVRRHLAARFQADQVAGDQPEGFHLHFPAVPDHNGRRLRQFFQGIQRLLGLPLLHHPHRRVQAHHRDDDDGVADLAQEHRNRRSRQQHIDQRIVELFEKTGQRALSFRSRQLVGPFPAVAFPGLFPGKPGTHVRFQKLFCLFRRFVFKHPCPPVFLLFLHWYNLCAGRTGYDLRFEEAVTAAAQRGHGARHIPGNGTFLSHKKKCSKPDEISV